MKTVINLFHPNYQYSQVNRAMVDDVKDEIEVRNLAELYPDFNIDIKKEQQVMANADRIVLQFPLQWYSTPALLKHWEDQVFTYGWAYGSQGNALQDKQLLIAVTVGADNYGRDGFVKYTVDELLRPLQATSRLIGMKYMKPFVVMGASSISNAELKNVGSSYRKYLNDETIPVLGDFE